MKNNICEIVIGRGILKWDAAWRIIEWLADPDAGHGLKNKFKDKLLEHCLGSGLNTGEIAVEYYLGKDNQGKSRHPDIAIATPSLVNPDVIALMDDLANINPNSSRKISNLLAYNELCAEKFPDAERKIVVITDTTKIERFVKLDKAFDAKEDVSLVYLPLQQMGEWVAQIPHSNDRIVEDFVEWSTSL